MDLALNNPRKLICHKTKNSNQTKPNQTQAKICFFLQLHVKSKEDLVILLTKATSLEEKQAILRIKIDLL